MRTATEGWASSQNFRGGGGGSRTLFKELGLGPDLAKEPATTMDDRARQPHRES